jgi:hypothetical protein
MLGFEFREELFDVPDSSLPDILIGLSNGFMEIGIGCKVEQALILFRILNDGSRFALDRKNDGP